MSKQIRNRCPAALLCVVIALAIMIPSFASLATVVGAKNRAVLLADLTKGDTNVNDQSYNIRANNWEDSTTFSENGAHISFPSGGNDGALQVRLQNVDLSSKKYIYFKITKDVKDGNNSAWMEQMQIQQTSGSWKAHAASKLEWKAPGGEWSASTDNTFVMYNNDNERWFRYETAEFVNDGFTAVNNGYVIYIRFTPWHECAVTVSNVYLANKDVDVPGVIDEQKAVRVADLTKANLDTNQFSDSTVVDENGLSFTVPADGSNNKVIQIIPDVTNLSGNQYLYFRISKSKVESDDCSAFINLQLAETKTWKWVSGNGADVKNVGDTGWAHQDGSQIVLYGDNSEVWVRYNMQEYVDNGFPGINRIDRLHFVFQQWNASNITIREIWAANADEDVPGLGLKPAGYTATFVNGDKAVVALQGMTVTAPDAVAIDGFQFVGWADADDYSKVYKAGSTITLTEDTTFVAAGISLETLNSASIRWSADDAKRGLRFTNVVRSNLGGAKETGELVSPALVKTAIKDLGNNQLKDVLNSSAAGGNSCWAEESTVTDLCWHGSVTKFAGKGDEVISQKFSAWAVAEIRYQDGSSGWFVSEATDGFSMKDVAVALKEANTDTSAANYDYINRILKEVYNVG